jgi:hypothetical protein
MRGHAVPSVLRPTRHAAAAVQPTARAVRRASGRTGVAEMAVVRAYPHGQQINTRKVSVR